MAERPLAAAQTFRDRGNALACFRSGAKLIFLLRRPCRFCNKRSLDHFPFAFGRSTRSSRNSEGPFVSCRLRWARSSGGAAGSTIFSIALVASSWARNFRPSLLTGLAGVLTVSPSSTRRRMASERPVSFATDQASTSAISAAAFWRIYAGPCRTPAFRVFF
jgi:hypothetical protein